MQEQKLMLLRRCIAPSLSLVGLQTTPPMLPHKQCQAENPATSSNCELSLCVDGRPTCDIARYDILRRWQPPYVHTRSSGDTSKLKCLIIPAVSHPILIAAPLRCYIQPITVEAAMKVSIDRPATPDPVAVRQGSISSTVALSTAHLASMTDPLRGKAPKGSTAHKPTPTQLSFILLKLREELPVLFGGHHSYDLYSPNVKLENNLSAFSWTTHGRRSYECFVRCSLWSVYCCYRQPQLELLKITKQLGSGTIEARWRITGIPRAWIRSKRRAVLDGFSTFLVDCDGFIATHKMDKVMPAPKEKSRVQSWMAQLTMALGLSPKPALELEPP